jgi:nucleotide-binding universal stress UspA family protein
MYERSLIQTDGSDHAVRAAEHAVALSRVFDATVRVVGVAGIQGAAGPFDAGGVDDAFVDELKPRASESIRTTETVTGRRVATAVLEGKPADAMVPNIKDTVWDGSLREGPVSRGPTSRSVGRCAPDHVSEGAVGAVSSSYFVRNS